MPRAPALSAATASRANTASRRQSVASGVGRGELTAGDGEGNGRRDGGGGLAPLRVGQGGGSSCR